MWFLNTSQQNFLKFYVTFCYQNFVKTNLDSLIIEKYSMIGFVRSSSSLKHSSRIKHKFLPIVTKCGENSKESMQKAIISF